MKEHPILFQPDMVRAILDGRKTMTRRIVKFPKDYDGGLIMDNSPYGLKYSTSPDTMERLFCPYGQPVDVLWVREMYAIEHLWPTPHGKYLYKADNPTELNLKWHPSIHMPKEACRLWLRITDVRVERIQDINNADIFKEGAVDIGCVTYRINMRFLWDRINEKRGFGWDENPYVWVIEFERI